MDINALCQMLQEQKVIELDQRPEKIRVTDASEALIGFLLCANIWRGLDGTKLEKATDPPTCVSTQSRLCL